MGEEGGQKERWDGGDAAPASFVLELGKEQVLQVETLDAPL